MKKIIAIAVAGAFAVPALAADITVSGSQEFSFKDVNGISTSAIDGTISFGASTTTANGIEVSMNSDITAEGGDDEAATLTMSGPFGSISAGTVSGASDKFDDRNDYDKVLGTSLSNSDAAIGYTLPAMVNGLTVYVSAGADNNETDTENQTGFGLEYAVGPIEVAYAVSEFEDNTDQTYVGATVTFGGVALSIENAEDGESGATTEQQSVGAKYSMGDVTVFVSQQTDEGTDGVKTADVTAMGIHYSLGGGVTAFAETSSDDKDAALDSTAVGVEFKF